MKFKNLVKADPKIWNGRHSPKNSPNQYYHENVNEWDDKGMPSGGNSIPIVLMGYAVDEGVKRNLGRVGAAHGPDAIRRALSGMAFHHHRVSIFDKGNISGAFPMEELQDNFADCIANLIEQKCFPIGLGGGHDMAYAHYKGLKKALPNQRIGILNFDAHFDLRPVVDKPNSGTPFWQILREFYTDSAVFDYSALGIRKNSNPTELFHIADQHQTLYFFDNQCNNSFMFENIKQRILAFLAPLDGVYITVDMDCFSAAYSPGVSAASPFGIRPEFVFDLLETIFETKKVVSMDFAETNPKYDSNGLTSKLAAGFIDGVVGWLS